MMRSQGYAISLCAVTMASANAITQSWIFRNALPRETMCVPCGIINKAGEQAGTVCCKGSFCAGRLLWCGSALASPFGRGLSGTPGRRGSLYPLSVTPSACQLSQRESQSVRCETIILRISYRRLYHISVAFASQNSTVSSHTRLVSSAPPEAHTAP